MMVAQEEARELIAAMSPEWGVRWNDDTSGDPYDWGFATRDAAKRWEKANRRYGPGRGRIVCRYVTEPWEDE